jgi:phage repressor protein C with HTH and peptisase S24 domain
MDNNSIPWDAGNLHDTFHSINIDKPDSVTEHQDDTSFECSVDDVEVIGRAVKIIKSI